jgi:hypothetical protein
MLLVNLYFVVRRAPYLVADPGKEETPSALAENS